MEKVVQNLKIESEKRIDAYKNIKLVQATQKGNMIEDVAKMCVSR